MSKFPRIVLLFVAGFFLVGMLGACASKTDHDALRADLNALKDSLKVYLVDGRPGDPTAIPPIPSQISLDKWATRLRKAVCQLEVDIYDDMGEAPFFSPNDRMCLNPAEAGTDPPGSPPPPPGL